METDESDRMKLLAIDKFLEQVKLLTALATALLLSPSVLITISQISSSSSGCDKDIRMATLYLVVSSLSFVLVILMNYMIFSSIAGKLYEGEINLYRFTTRLCSVFQLLFLVVGCVFLIMMVLRLLG